MMKSKADAKPVFPSYHRASRSSSTIHGMNWDFSGTRQYPSAFLRPSVSLERQSGSW
ncbi:hypothetical protein K0M31_002077 [Melipona bicolor]|uniref:Uncharacterized protein n=1 Tax=Melipona bicolor TaxID=60889 RepID=A0AA40GGW0_9HYME|nr:hypothetical protein K0M31_002077 [Melipona bicolor]